MHSGVDTAMQVSIWSSPNPRLVSVCYSLSAVYSLTVIDPGETITYDSVRSTTLLHVTKITLFKFMTFD